MFEYYPAAPFAVIALTTPPAACGYLPDQVWTLQYLFVAQASAAEYEEYLKAGWRRFGRAFFHPVCKSCHRCRSVRVPVATFQPDRSQRRARKANADVELVIGEMETELAAARRASEA